MTKKRFTKQEDARLLDIRLLPMAKRKDALAKLAQEMKGRTVFSLYSRLYRLSNLKNKVTRQPVRETSRHLDIKIKRIELVDTTTLRVHF